MVMTKGGFTVLVFGFIGPNATGRPHNIRKRDVSTVIDILKQIAQRFMLPAAAGGEQRSTVAVQRRG